MYKCKKCNLEFTTNSALSVHNYYNRNNKEKCRTKKNENKHKCKFCNIEIIGNALGGHTTWCSLNPNRKKNQEICRKANTNKKHSQKSKDKISAGMTKYLTENPDKVPYLLNHSSYESYPEKIFRNALESSNINNWVTKFRNGIYQYDFAFPDLKIDVEIDGETHLTEKVKKIDKRRDEFSRNNGWKVLRFTAKEVKENVIDCINKLKKIISS